MVATSTKRTAASLIIVRVVAVVTACYISFLIYAATQARPHAKSTVHRGKAYHQVVQHTEYKALLPELLTQPAPHYVLFTSGTLNGNPWCPDCSHSLPVVRTSVASVGGSLLEVEVGSPSDWSDRQHPLRVDAAMPVAYVPTLYHYSSTGAGARISTQLNSDSSVEELRVAVATFLKQTAGASHSVVSFAQVVLESKGKKCGGC